MTRVHSNCPEQQRRQFVAANGIGTKQWIGQCPTDVVSCQEAATHLDLILAVASLGFVPVVGGDGDEPLLAKLLVTLCDGLDEVTGELIGVTHGLAILLGVRSVTVPSVVDPFEVDDGSVRALVQQVPGGPRRHLLVGPVNTLRQVGTEQLVLAGALLVHPLMNEGLTKASQVAAAMVRANGLAKKIWDRMSG